MRSGPNRSESEIAQTNAALIEQLIAEASNDVEGDEASSDRRSLAPDQHFSCSLCDGVFARRYTLSRHIRTMHEGDRPHKCNICQQTFGQASDMKRHQQDVHSDGGNGNKHECKDFELKNDDGISTSKYKGCGKSFVRLTTLKRHQNTIKHSEAVAPKQVDEDFGRIAEGIPLEAWEIWQKTHRMTNLQDLKESVAAKMQTKSQEQTASDKDMST